MNWVKAKNISIIAFILLNITLGFLRHVDNRRYMISMQSQNAVTAVLNDNNITLNYNFTFFRHYPKKQISLLHTEFNQNSMINIFMINNQNISVTSERYKTTFKNDYEKVIFEENKITYKNLANTDISIENENQAKAFANQFIRSFGEMGRSFVLDNAIVSDTNIVLEYRQKYRNYIIFSNYIIFTFENNTIKEIKFSYNSVDGFIGNTREIRPPDEALITFMRHARGLYGEKNIEIQKMDLVYKQAEPSSIYESGFVAVPFYRIHYKVDNINQTSSMLINAYSNTVM